MITSDIEARDFGVLLAIITVTIPSTVALED
jgi:hypothetical protein